MAGVKYDPDSGRFVNDEAEEAPAEAPAKKRASTKKKDD